MRPLNLLLLATLGFSAVGSAMAAPGDTAEIGPKQTTLEDDLFRETDLKLKGLTAWETVAFPVPRGWDLQSDPQLHLQFAHSQTLDPAQSKLTILVNDTNISSTFLDDTNANDGEMVVEIPRHLLKPYNRLSFTVEQRTASSCVDAFDPSLWTRVSNQSFIEWDYEATEVETDLAAFPYPLFDDRGYGPLALTLVGPDRMSNTTMQATARLAQGLGRIADYRGVKVEPPVYDVRGAKTPALLLGTVPELPGLTDLIGDPALRAGEALITVIPNPARPDLPVLVIAGTTAESLDAAVDALVTEGHTQVLAGERVVIYEKPVGTLIRSKRELLPVGDADRFTFADVGVADKTVRGFYAPNAKIPLRFDGNTQVHRFGLEAVIHYAYAANLDTRLSTMEVRLNGVAIDSVVLDNPSGADSVWHPLRVPSQVVTPHSELEVVFNLFPKDHKTCTTHPDRTTWASVYSDSELHIPRDGIAKVPDLGLLKYDMWPFTLDRSGETVLVVSDEPTRAHMTPVIELAAELARVSKSSDPRLHVTTASDWTNGAYDGRHAVLLSSREDDVAFTRVGNKTSLGVEVTSNGERRKTTLPFVQEVVSPFDDQRLIMVLRGEDPEELSMLVRRLSDPAELVHFEDDLAIVQPDDELRTLAIARTQQIGSMSVWGWIRGLPLERYWVLIVLGLVASLFAAAAVIGSWARRHGGTVS